MLERGKPCPFRFRDRFCLIPSRFLILLSFRFSHYSIFFTESPDSVQGGLVVFVKKGIIKELHMRLYAVYRESVSRFDSGFATPFSRSPKYRMPVRYEKRR